VDDPSDGPPSAAGPKKTVTGDILDGDSDAEGDSFHAVDETVSTHDGGTADIDEDGDFVFRPAAGCSDHEDSFVYHLTDGEDTGTGTVTIEVQDCVWYADSTAATNGNGTSGSPFKTLNSLNGFDANVDGPGNTLYLAGGTYSGGLPLEDDQRLHSRRHGLTMPDGGTGTVTLDAALPAGPASQVDGGLVLADDNDVQGIELGSAAANFALSGTSVGTAHVNDVTAGLINNPSGGAIGIGVANPLDVNDVDIAMASVTSSGAGAEAIRLVNVDGTVDLGGGTLSNAATNTVAIDGGDADFTYDGSVDDDAGRLVDIRNKTGGTNDFNGAVTNLPLQATDDLGGGISLQSNDTLTRFDGGLTLGTGTANGLVATGGGRLAVTGDHNTITTNQGGSAVALAFTDIHADGLNFESLSSKNANPGVSLQSTGDAGHLTVTGNAAGDPGSGGTIATSVGRGIFLDTLPDGLDLRHMSVTGGGDDGVRAIDVDGLAMSDSTVSNNGNATGERGFEITGGTTSLTDLAVSGNRDDGVEIDARPTDPPPPALPVQRTATATVSDSTISGPFTPGQGEAIDLQQTFASQIRATLDGNTLDARAGNAIRAGSDGTGSVRALVTGNTVAGAPGFAINGMFFNQNDASRLDATVKGNSISGPGSGAQAGLRAAGDDDGTVCLDAGDPTDAAQKNSLTNSGGATSTDIVVNQQAQSTFILPGYTGANDDTTAVANYLTARNDGNGTPDATATSASPPGYVSGTCLLP
jgi:large repetitive protein